jgi:hypothetical protein
MTRFKFKRDTKNSSLKALGYSLPFSKKKLKEGGLFESSASHSHSILRGNFLVNLRVGCCCSATAVLFVN